jgi:hypothetical protein
MRILLGLCVVLILGGCNRVYTPAPLFTAADGAAMPTLRDGIWLVEGMSMGLDPLGGDPRCKVDTSKSVTRWRKCATWLLIRSGRILQLSSDRKDPYWTATSYLAVPGDPQIFQVVDAGDASKATDESETDKPSSPPSFGYFAVAPSQVGADGKATAFESWPVLCGPSPPKAKKGEDERYLTLELNPGLVEDGNNCTTTSKDALRAAAVASRAWQGEILKARWIRDTYP